MNSYSSKLQMWMPGDVRLLKAEAEYHLQEPWKSKIVKACDMAIELYESLLDQIIKTNIFEKNIPDVGVANE